MNVSIAPDLERRIAERVANGDHLSPSDVISEALTLFFSGSETAEERRARFDADIKVGLDQLDRGEGVAGEQVFAELAALS